MALNNSELKIIYKIIKKYFSNQNAKILFLGYPDLFCCEATCPIPFPSYENVPKRKGTSSFWLDKGIKKMFGQDLISVKDLFKMLGTEPVISDAINWCNEDILLDLNEKINPELYNEYDIIIDPGTLEHCFDIYSAFHNVHKLLKTSGFIYHQAACAYPNHGFYSISPTTFYDWYEQLEYELDRPMLWASGADEIGSTINMVELDPFAMTNNVPSPGTCSYLFRKNKNHVNPQKPVQRCYSSKKRQVLYNPNIIEEKPITKLAL
jgi:hypothetical protein